MKDEKRNSQTCPRCEGNGLCRDCKGTGKIDCPSCQGLGKISLGERSYNCHSCQGTGKIPCPPQCPSCSGTGEITLELQETIKKKYNPVSVPEKITGTITKVIVSICVALYIASPPDLPRVFHILPDPYPYLIWHYLIGSMDVWQSGEYWRILTPAFLHGGIIHLFCNTLFLLGIGPPVEAVLGAKRYIALYLLSAVGGCLLSSFMNPIGGIGASGAIFGVATASIAMSRRWDTFPRYNSNYLLKTLLVILALGFFLGDAFGFRLDNWGHIGGGIVGFAFIYCMKRP